MSLDLGNDAADRTVSALLDESGGTGKGYDRLWVDADNDGDLCNQPALRVQSKRQGRTVSLHAEPIEVLIRYAHGARRRYRVRLDVRGYARSASLPIAWSAACHLDQHARGALRIGDRPAMLAAVFDSSREGQPANGCFDDYGTDRLRIDLDGNGVLDPGAEDFPLSKVVSIDGRLWSVEVDSAGSRLQTARYEGPTGRIHVAGGFPPASSSVTGRAEFRAHGGIAVLLPLRFGADAEMPAGVYRVENGLLTRTDAEGRAWDAAFTMQTPLPVEPGKTSSVVLGLPLTVEPMVDGEPMPGVSICITAAVRGAGGEEYGNIAPSGARMSPAFSIVDAEEVVVLEGKMEYG
jgi:hypothetical protein